MFFYDVLLRFEFITFWIPSTFTIFYDDHRSLLSVKCENCRLLITKTYYTQDMLTDGDLRHEQITILVFPWTNVIYVS